jgi:hypothetical protein
MTSRDLYAACVGLHGGLALQFLVRYLMYPSFGLAVCLVTVMFCFLISLILHVTAIVKQYTTTSFGTNSKSDNHSASVAAPSLAHTAKRTSHSMPFTARADDITSSAHAAPPAVGQ